MPTMPIESVAPPEELEDANWPLQAHGDALELPDAAGSGSGSRNGERNC